MTTTKSDIENIETVIQDFILNYMSQHTPSRPDRVRLADQLAQSPALMAPGLLDSLSLMGLFSALETHFQIELDFFEQDPQIFTTFHGLSQLCAQAMRQRIPA